MHSLPGNLVTFGPHANCTLDLCPASASILSYQPSVPANAFFAAIFLVALIAHLIQGIRARTWGFAASLVLGCIFEIVGYIGRLMLHKNPFNFHGFLIQIGVYPIRPHGHILRPRLANN